MIEYKIDTNTHIGGWFMPEKICDDIIKYFNSNKDLQHEGVAASGGAGKKYANEPTLNIKKSTDITILENDISEPFGSYRVLLQECLDNYIKKYEHVNSNNKFNINTPYNIQYYKPNEGYKIWHFENAGNRNRLLAFMTYLNDCDDGGTEFKYQDLITPAKKGLTVIWPANWTHTHKGQISKTKEKYIVTGWYTFNA